MTLQPGATERNSSGLLSTLFWQPGTFAAGVVVAVGYYAHLALHVTETIAGITWIAVSLATFHANHLSHVARLTRAMAEVGLVQRRHDGIVVIPRRVGRVRRHRRNYTAAWVMPPGVTLRDVNAKVEALEQHCCVGLRFWHSRGLLYGEVLRHGIPDVVDFRTFYQAVNASSGDLMVGIGRGQRGPIVVDVADLPHLLVGGQTGGGKSVFLRQLLTGLLLTHEPDELQLACIDLKGGVELHRFAALPHAIAPVADTVADSVALLDQVRAELDRRLRKLRAEGLSDIRAWRNGVNPRWPNILVVVDEVAELTARGLTKDGRSERDAATGRLCEIARLGRAAGVHLIVCTQRPDAEAVPGQLKANLPATVAFRVRNAINSRILLDTDRAAQLPPMAGRGVWVHDGEEEFQGIYLSPSESARVLDDRWRGYGGLSARQLAEHQERADRIYGAEVVA